MAKRLVWNFEINANSPLEMPGPESMNNDSNRWESRFFWGEDLIITLHGLNHRFLELSQYQIKHREDTYFLVPNTDYNLKIRRDALFYKPILSRNPQAIAFGKKIRLDEQPHGEKLPGCMEKDAHALIDLVRSQGKKIPVEKEALIYKFDTSPSTKLELSRLQIGQKAYFSVCIASRSANFVELFSRQLLGEMPNCDYVTFLQHHLTSS